MKFRLDTKKHGCLQDLKENLLAMSGSLYKLHLFVSYMSGPERFAHLTLQSAKRVLVSVVHLLYILTFEMQVSRLRC